MHDEKLMKVMFYVATRACFIYLEASAAAISLFT